MFVWPALGKSRSVEPTGAIHEDEGRVENSKSSMALTLPSARRNAVTEADAGVVDQAAKSVV